MTTKISYGLGTLFWMSIAVAIIGYFVYDKTIEGALGCILYNLGFYVLSLFGIIPVLGQVLYLSIGSYWLNGAILGLVGLSSSWIITGIFWFNFLMSCLISLMILIIAAAFVFRD